MNDETWGQTEVRLNRSKGFVNFIYYTRVFVFLVMTFLVIKGTINETLWMIFFGLFWMVVYARVLKRGKKI